MYTITYIIEINVLLITDIFYDNHRLCIALPNTMKQFFYSLWCHVSQICVGIHPNPAADKLTFVRGNFH